MDHIVDEDRGTHEALHKLMETTPPTGEPKGYLVSEISLMIDLIEALQARKQGDKMEDEDDLEDEVPREPISPPVIVAPSPSGSSNMLSSIFQNTAIFVRAGIERFQAQPKGIDTSSKRPRSPTSKEDTAAKRKPEEDSGKKL